MIALISGRSGAVGGRDVVPVRAVTVTSEVISEPELVMNALAPLTTHSPSTSSALVLRGARVGAGTRLGEAEAGERAAGDQVGQPRCFCSCGAVGLDRVDAQPHRGLEGDADRLVDAAELLDRHAQAGEVAVVAHAAVLLGRGEPEQPEVAHLVHEVDREVVVLVPLRDVRRDLLAGEVAHAGAEGLVLGAELERRTAIPLAAAGMV